MAKLDVVNEHDEVIGIAEYGEVGRQHLRHRVSRIFLFDDQGRLYLQRRSLKMEAAPGVWDQSAAGHVDLGETYDQAATRELKEELGLTGIFLKRLTIYYHEEPHPRYGHMKRFHGLFKGQYNGQPIVHQEEEVMDGKWVTLTELEDWIARKPQDFSGAFIDAYRRYKTL